MVSTKKFVINKFSFSFFFLFFVCNDCVDVFLSWFVIYLYIWLIELNWSNDKILSKTEDRETEEGVYTFVQ